MYVHRYFTAAAPQFICKYPLKCFVGIVRGTVTLNWKLKSRTTNRSSSGYCTVVVQVSDILCAVYEAGTFQFYSPITAFSLGYYA